MARTYNDALSGAVEPDKLIPDVPLSAVEILAFFPKHLRWASVWYRLAQAGFSNTDIAKAQLHARGRLTSRDLELRQGALRHAVLVAGKRFFNDPNFTPTRYRHDPRMQPIDPNNYPAGDCVAHYDGTEINEPLSSLDSNPPTLQQVANGVVNFRQGSDAGVLTAAIEWAAVRGELSTRTVDEVATIVEENNISVPADAHGHQWDQTCLNRVQAIPRP